MNCSSMEHGSGEGRRGRGGRGVSSSLSKWTEMHPLIVWGCADVVIILSVKEDPSSRLLLDLVLFLYSLHTHFVPVD